MATMWESRELERRTAARVAAAGFTPAVNVVHADTQSEFDIYAFLPTPDSLERLLIQCSVPRPGSEKVKALKTDANAFDAQHSLVVTSASPHETQQKLAALHGIHLVGESSHSTVPRAVVAGRVIDVQQPLSVREQSILAYLRCLARLRRVALENRERHQQAGLLVEVWNALDGLSLVSDPFERLGKLYAIHQMAPNLSQDCALAEGLAGDGYRALKLAFGYNRGTYTQAALAVQTMNRLYTLVAFCECACLVAEGEQVPSYLAREGGRRGPLIRWLSEQPGRHLLANVAYEFVCGWGGLWQAMDLQLRDMLASSTGITPDEVDQMIGYVSHIFRDEGMGQFIKQAGYRDIHWESLVLLPYFAKGIGIRRLRAEAKADLLGEPWANWSTASMTLERECRDYEMGH